MPFPTPSGFVNQTALAAALLVVPLVILYLLKPKPKLIKFPTVMFIKKIEETRVFTSLLNRFIKDPLLLMQAVIITLLALALANPYFLITKTEVVDEAVAIVIDGSASMQATDVKPTRFEAAVEKAEGIVKGLSANSRVSIVIAENIPVMVLADGSPERALDVLGRLSCGDTPSNTGDAMMLAKDLISNSELKKTVYLLSDFARAEGDLTASSRILRLNGIDVNYVRFNGEGSNLGIVGIDARRTPINMNVLYMTYTVRNFDPVEREVTGRVYVNDVLAATHRSILGPSSEVLFYVNSSISKDRQWISVELAGGGALGMDDRGYSAIRELRTYRTILLTSGEADRYVSYAIESQVNNRLRTAEPPVIPSLDEFDVIVVGGVKRDSILPGTFRDIKRAVESGKTLIIVASGELADMRDSNLDDMMPVILNKKTELERNVKAASHEILNDVSLENTVIKRYYTASARENATVIAETEGSPLVAYWNYGGGVVAYVGINPSKEWSNMQYSSSFPIFWSQLIEYASRRGDKMKNPNLKTGQYLVLEKEADITSPSGATTNAKSIFLDRQGFYRIKKDGGEEAVAVNLENADESDIKTAIHDVEEANATPEGEKTLREELLKYIITLVALAVFLEILVYRRRGRI